MDHLSKIIASLQQEHRAIMEAGAFSQQAAAQFEHRCHAALNRHPDNPHIVYTLGTFYSQTDRPGAGINLLRRSMALGNDGPDAWNNLGAAYKIEHDDAKSEECYKKAIAMCEKGLRKKLANEADIKASYAVALHGIAALYVNAGKPHEIIKWANKALELDPKDHHAEWNRGLGYLESGEWAKGWEAYDEAGFVLESRERRKVKTYGGLPRWKGEKGKTVICYGEQGVGDEIMFASMLPDLMRDCRVIIDCDARLENLFRQSFPDAVAIYPTSDRDAPFPWIKNHPDVDGWVPMGSLGRYYRPDAASFPRTPYLKADPSLVGKWANALGQTDKMRIGISWAGGTKKTRIDQRSIPLNEWAEVLSIPGIQWHSFQYHQQAAQETADVGRALGVPIHHWVDVIGSYDSTAAVLQSMDLVITVCTSLVHLCGALGVETWCLGPKMIAWRYGCEGPMPWYGSVEMLRQQEAGNWKPTLETVRDALLRLTAKEAA